MNGFTAVPRWTTNPVPGVGEHRVKIPETLTGSLLWLANDLGVPLSAVLLTAHARVLTALSGEGEAWIGYVVGSSPPMPLQLRPGTASWREVLLDTARAESELVVYRGVRVSGLTPERAIMEPSYETVFVLGGEGRDLPGETVLRVSFLEHKGLELRLCYPTDVLNADCAARICGYHLRALSLMAADPDALHAKQSLLSEGELVFQVHDLAGPRRERPNRRAHEIFEERVSMHPNAIAIRYGDSQLTYAQLNANANQLARALLARRMQREGVVGVVTERNPNWVAAMLAIFKAGGAYLPIEPHFPADRIGSMLSRSGCRLVLTEQGSNASLDQALRALSGIETLYIDTVFEEGHAEGNPDISVEANQLAYVFFTSGSTGEPKGAMCEHAGMLNHLYAKIEDLGICQGDVVTETAPQCFDISLWQSIAPLLAGATTLIVEQETILDAKRFIDSIVEHRVTVVQVVPSYLEVLASYLAEHPRELPDLRRVSTTGEALKKELVERWFAVQPRIPLVNAYGLTETSDDTNHEIMEGVPDSERIPLGRPIPNVHVYVVDEYLSPVPLGAPGEIVFSGVCVGRGYINDPERTQRSFLPDPHRGGERLYRSGDFGRWLADGKLEYLGRRDSQVKISGFRIEIGEIENRLLRLPGVREGAVVVTEHGDTGKHLVAFYAGDGRLDSAFMHDELGKSLPAYMIPSAFYLRQTLPLTGNGKINRNALTALARELDVAEQNQEALSTETERKLAAAWASVLGIRNDHIGKRAHFFELGGTSLSVVRLAIALDRAISFKELAAHPILADQAELLDRRLEQEIPAPSVGVPADRCGATGSPAVRGNEWDVPR